MVNAQIQQQREEFVRARTMLQQAQARVPQITQRTLRSGGLETRQRTRESLAKSEVITKEKERLSQAESKFESQVKKQQEIEALKRKYGDIKNTIKVTRKEIAREQLKLKQAQDFGNTTAQRKILRKINLLQGNLTKYLKVKEQEGLIKVDFEKPNIPLAFQQEFTQEQIGGVLGMSKASELLTQAERRKIRAVEFLKDVAEQGRFKTKEIQRFETMGYSTKEATALAETALRTQRTPSPDQAQQILRQEGIIAPSGFLPKIEYGIEKGTQYIGKQTDIGLGKLGVPERFRTVYYNYQIPKIKESFEQKRFIAGTPQTAKITAGKVVGTATDVGLWVVPVVGTTRAVAYVGATGEKLIRKEPVSLQEGIFSTLLVGAGALKAFKGLKTKTAPQERIVKTGLPKAEQYVIYDPKLKKIVTKSTPEAYTLTEKPVGLVISKIDTGLVKLTTQKGKAPIVKPIKQSIVSGTITKEGLFKMLPKRQALVLTPTTTQKIFGREFAQTSSVFGKVSTGGKISTESFIVGTKIGEKSVIGRGLAKVKTTAPRIQRTGEVKGTFEEIGKGFIKKTPVRVYEGFTTFKPLYKKEPLSLSRVRTTVIGQPAKAKEVFSIKDIIPQVQVQTGSTASFIQAVYGKAPIALKETKAFTPKPAVVSNVVKSAPALGLASKAIERPIPESWKGVYDVPSTEQVYFEMKPQMAGLSATQQSTFIQQTGVLSTQDYLGKYKQKQDISQKDKQLQKQLQISSTSEITKSLSKLKQEKLFKTKLKQREIQIAKQVPRKTTEPITRTPRTPIIPFPTIDGTTTGGIPKEGSFKVQGFDVFIRKKGKWIKVSKQALTKVEALKLGSKITRETLVASFKISKSPQFIAKKKNQVYVPSKEIFRSYKIVKGKKIPLANTYIQKASKRLGTMGERKQIQKARRVKWI
jgi:hypothetical protein